MFRNFTMLAISLLCATSTFGAPDFETEVIPVLTKAGCNNAACHGAAIGRGGFRLSLLGYDPKADKPSPALRYPSMGSIVSHCQNGKPVMPPYVLLRTPNLRAANSVGNGFLPGSRRPFEIQGDPSKPDFRVRDLSTPNGLSQASLDRRRDFRDAFDNLSEEIEENKIRQQRDAQFEQAYRLILSPQAKQAFDLSKESTTVRNRYRRTRLGQCCLMARRLVEAGCPFVTVTDDGWDNHSGIYNILRRKVPGVDNAVASLIEDLNDRGLLDETLVVVMGEFGRTPRLNTSSGRDHWPRVFSVMLAGGGIKGGQVIGKSDPRGTRPADRPVSPSDLAATIYKLIGIEPDREFHTGDGRPIRASMGEVISEVVG